MDAWISNKMPTYTLRRRRTGCNQDAETLTKNPYLHLVPTSHWGEFVCFGGNQKRPPTLREGVALGSIWKSIFYHKNAYLHFVPTLRWVQLLYWSFNEKAFAYTLHWCRTGTSFDTEGLDRKRIPTLCADIALGQIFISKA